MILLKRRWSVASNCLKSVRSFIQINNMHSMPWIFTRSISYITQTTSRRERQRWKGVRKGQTERVCVCVCVGTGIILIWLQVMILLLGVSWSGVSSIMKAWLCIWLRSARTCATLILLNQSMLRHLEILSTYIGMQIWSLSIDQWAPAVCDITDALLRNIGDLHASVISPHALTLIKVKWNMQHVPTLRLRICSDSRQLKCFILVIKSAL